jgi:putative alpha-1,2-mannosidase
MAFSLNNTSLNFPFQEARIAIESGAVFSFTNTTSITARFGVSFISAKQACANAEQEISAPWNWQQVQESSRSAWEETLDRVKIDPAKEEKTVVELLYSSVRSIWIRYYGL